MKSKLGALLVLVALSSAVMMLGYQKYLPSRAAREPVVAIPEIKVEPREPIAPRSHRSLPGTIPPSDRPEAPSRVTLYVTRPVNNDIRLVPIHEPVAEATPFAALKALAAYGSEGTVDRALPKGTQVLGVTVGGDGTATADFSHEIVDNFPGGSHTEQIMLASIVDTLTQFPSIKRVMITVDGKPVDSIGGHIELDEPLERDMEFVVKNPEG